MSPNTSYLERPWRVDHNAPWNMYVMLGDEPSRADPPLAVALNSLGLAEVVADRIVTEHNRRLEELRHG